MYQITGYKNFKGHEGEPCGQGNIAKDGKKIAEWSDDSWGGPMRIAFTNKSEEASFLTWAKTYIGTRKNYEDKLYNPSEMTDWDIQESTLFQMSIEHAEKKELEKAVKKGLVAKIRENGKVETYTYKMAFTAENVAKLRVKHGDNLIEIVNETMGMPMIDDAIAKIKAENDRYKKLCKSSILFSIRKDDGTVTMMQTKLLYSASTAQMVRERNKNLVEIINERFL